MACERCPQRGATCAPIGNLCFRCEAPQAGIQQKRRSARKISRPLYLPEGVTEPPHSLVPALSRANPYRLGAEPAALAQHFHRAGRGPFLGFDRPTGGLPHAFAQAGVLQQLVECLG